MSNELDPQLQNLRPEIIVLRPNPSSRTLRSSNHAWSPWELFGVVVAAIVIGNIVWWWGSDFINQLFEHKT